VIAVCGVCGTYATDGRLDRSIAAAMHARQVHRGPDETYSLNTETLAAKLGRLGMTGLVDGWQPAEDRSGRYVAMTNGEVYNSEALRQDLGTSGRGNGVDVAVIPELVARYGIHGLRLVDGQFATVIFDRTENSLRACTSARRSSRWCRPSGGPGRWTSARSTSTSRWGTSSRH